MVDRKPAFKFVTCPSPSFAEGKGSHQKTGGVLVQVGIPVWVQEPGIVRAHFTRRKAADMIEVPQSRPRIR